MAKRGPKGKAVVWVVSDDIEFKYPTVKHAAEHLKTIYPNIKSSIPTVSTMISLSCSIDGRKVAGQKFRWATERDGVNEWGDGDE
jgi:hypothetical protein